MTPVKMHLSPPPPPPGGLCCYLFYDGGSVVGCLLFYEPPIDGVGSMLVFAFASAVVMCPFWFAIILTRKRAC